MNWSEIKTKGSRHYKKSPDEVEPIDLYRASGMLRDFALSNIIKYAYRNRAKLGVPINQHDMDKIIHYTEMLKCIAEEDMVLEKEG